MTPPITETVPQPVFGFDDFELDIPAFELRLRGIPVPMEPQVFEVLAFLVENAGRVLTKDEILDRVWPERYVSEASLNSRVMSARKALGDSGAEQRYIRTVHGRGYRFVGAVADRVPAPSAATVAGGDTPRPNLPAPGTTFVGRVTELARITALLAQPSCRLLTIAGLGGIGKTRLALEVMAALPGASVFVPLEHVQPSALGATLASALGIQGGGDDPLDRVIRYLSTHELTLFLDNFEHLVEAARPLLTKIFGEASDTCIILTSRVVLGLPHEWVFRVEGLSLESEDDTPSEAESLFHERAHKAGAAFDALGASREVSRICRLADGMPLALELAASLARYLPLPSIADLLERDAEASFSTMAPGLPPRHRSVYALFEENLLRLSPSEREALTSLTVFDGSFDAAAAAAVATATLPELLAFVDGSLLQPGGGRFRMHPLLRQFLQQSPARVPDLHLRHARYYAEFVEARAPHLQADGQLAAIAEMEAEATNSISAWRWAAENHQSELLERSRKGLFTYLTFRGRFIEADALAGLALDSLDEQAQPGAAAALLVHHAWVLLRLGRTTKGTEAVARAMKLVYTAELEWLPGFGSDPRLVGVALRMGGGDYPGALALARGCLALARKAGDAAGAAFSAWVAAAALIRMAEVTCERDAAGTVRLRVARSDRSLDEAMDYLQFAAAFLNPNDEVWLRGYVEIELGLHAGLSGRPESARAHYRNAYALRSQLDDPQGMASSLTYLADSLIDAGDVAGACELHAEIATLLLRSGDATGRAELLRSQGIAAASAGDHDLARHKLGEAIEVSRALGFTNNVVGALRSLGDVFLAEGEAALGGRIMMAVAAEPGATPAARAKARHILETLALPVPAVGEFAEPTSELVNEVLRASATLRRWLSTGKAAAAPFAAA